MNTAIKKVALVAAISCTLSSATFAGTSANIGLTSDYVWRGVSQNNNDPALSAGLDYEAENGLYVGTWASNVQNDGKDVEIDLYGGYAGSVSGFGYDIGVITYQYPSATDLDFTEIYANTTFFDDMLEVGIASIVDADDSTIEGDTYSHVSINSNLGPFSMGTTIGNTNADGDDYMHVQTAFGYDIPDNFGNLSLAYDVTAGNLANANNSKTVSLSWTKSFDF